MALKPQTYVQCWPVGTSKPQFIRLSVDQIAGHLAEDWIPSLPIPHAAALMGWPAFLLSPIEFDNRDCLSLIARTGGTDRQWKGMMAWMLGVAGARPIIKRERYRWVAPASAFFRSNVQPVTLGSWPTTLPLGRVVVERAPGAKTRLTPDYLVLRSTAANKREWGVVEAKGSKRALALRHVCPADWKKQVRNVRVTVDEKPVKIPRHLVVATRVYPNAKKDVTRRLQIRAWNSAQNRAHGLDDAAVVDIVTAHLFGLFKTLQMPANSQALAGAMQSRVALIEQPGLFDSQERRADAAARELDERGGTGSQTNERRIVVRVEGAEVEVLLTSPLVDLVRSLQRVHTVHSGAKVVADADAALDEWEQRSASIDAEHRAVLSAGVELRFVRRPLE